MKSQVCLILNNKIGTLGGIFEILELGIGSIVGYYAAIIFKRNLSQEILNYEKELREIKKILYETKNSDGSNSSHHDQIIEEEKENANEDEEYEGGENRNFSRVQAYECKSENSEPK